MGVVKSKLRFKLLILAAILAGAAAPASAAEQQPKPARIDRNGVLILVRSTLIALDQANKTGNYTVLRDLGAPAFQANSAARLGEIFAGLRHESLDLSGVAVLDPELTLLPQIDADGMMRMTGFFPSAPAQINFDLVYAPVNGQWRLFAITVGLGQTAPVAPAPPAPAATAPPAPAEKPAPPEKKKHQKE
jgi:hypothetical protein